MGSLSLTDTCRCILDAILELQGVKRERRLSRDMLYTLMYLPASFLGMSTLARC